MYHRVRAVSFLGLAAVACYAQSGGVDCSFTSGGDDFLSRENRARRDVMDRVAAMRPAFTPKAATPLAAKFLPRRNYIDAEILDALEKAGTLVAPLSTDAEFIRRITLDLTGRLPSPADVRAFLTDTNQVKRDLLIDKLIWSPEFEDRWTVWVGDWLQNVQNATNVAEQIGGRDAFFNWIRDAIVSEKSFKTLAYEVVSAAGNTYDPAAGPTNFITRSTTPNGPIQDTYDTALVRAAGTFLGLGYYDCLLCHNGRGHLDLVSSWGAKTQRVEAWQMAAHFSRQRMANYAATQGMPLFGSYNVTEAASGAYDLNTNYGNRVTRAPIGTTKSLTPQYRNGNAPAAGVGWRQSFGQNMVEDPMFARNVVNRIWKQMFGLGLVDPVDTMDPDRLDPSKPPADPWALQATHPVLLEKLAADFKAGNYNLRNFIKTMVQSTAYQLSSRYDGKWTIDMTVLFARHYPRRLTAEEVADAIGISTAVYPMCTVTGWSDPVKFSMQTPDPLQCGNNAAILNAFLRGNRDTQARSSAGSILQQLAIMNDAYVTNRTKISASPTLTAISKLTSNGDVVDEIFLAFLARLPDDYEKDRALGYLAKTVTAALRNNAIEDLAWVCINKVDFLFSY